MFELKIRGISILSIDFQMLRAVLPGFSYLQYELTATQIAGRSGNCTVS